MPTSTNGQDTGGSTASSTAPSTGPNAASIAGNAVLGAFGNGAAGVQAGEDAATAAVNAGGAAASTVEGVAAVGNLAAHLTDGTFWKRIGIGAAGYALILFGLIFLLLSVDDVRGAAKAAGGTAAGIGIGLVPGGGAVTAAAKGVKGVAAAGKTAAQESAKTAAKTAAKGAS